MHFVSNAGRERFCRVVGMRMHFLSTGAFVFEILQHTGRRGTRAALCVYERHGLKARMYDRLLSLTPRLLIQKHSSTRRRRGLNYIIAFGVS